MTQIKSQIQTGSALEALLANRVSKAIPVVTSELRSAISNAIWEWPRSTKRRNGETVNSPRNIVDLGRLRSSLQVAQKNPTTWLFSWDTNYAIFVHQGYTTRDGFVAPPRPWTTVPDYESIIAIALSRN